MVRYGMTPLQAIQAATLNAAQALGREKDVGAIEVGRCGDLIAVDGDPIADVRLLEDVDVVIKGGEVVKGDSSPPAYRHPPRRLQPLSRFSRERRGPPRSGGR